MYSYVSLSVTDLKDRMVTFDPPLMDWIYPYIIGLPKYSQSLFEDGMGPGKVYYSIKFRFNHIGYKYKRKNL